VTTSTTAVKSADRVLRVLDELVDHPGGMTFKELVDRLDLPKSSLHALLATMLDRRYLVLDKRTRQYRLGIKIWEAGQSFLRDLDLTESIRAPMACLAETIGETVQCAVLDGTSNVYIHVNASGADHRLVLQSRIGSRLPAHSTGLGKALLAALSDDELRRRFAEHDFQRFTPNTISSLDELLQAENVVRQEGFARDNEEYIVGLRCIAGVIRDHEGEVVASISVAIPEVRWSRDWESKALHALRNAVTDISRSLGYDKGNPMHYPLG
jgi:IclR family KDG regulon transcriptional repressor